jgi:hypothetical protein
MRVREGVGYCIWILIMPEAAVSFVIGYVMY